MNYKTYLTKLFVSAILTLIITSLVFGSGKLWVNFVLTGLIYSFIYTSLFYILPIKTMRLWNSKKTTLLKRISLITILLPCALAGTILGQWITIELNYIGYSSFILIVLIIITVIILPIIESFKLIKPNSSD